MQHQGLENVLLFLQHFRTRPNMYVKPEVDTLVSFMYGLRIGISTLGFGVPEDIYREIVQARGWEHAASGFWDQMTEQGCSYEQIMQEFVAIQIEALKRVYGVDG
jgi:hypothetical protein